MDRINPLLITVFNANTDAAFEFMKYLVEKGADVNQVHNKNTLLDMVLSKRFYLTEEEKNAHISPVLNSYLENQLKMQEEGSYAYDAIKSYLDSQSKSHKKRKVTMWSKRQQEESVAWLKKVYEFLDSHGAMTWREMFEINGPEVMIEKEKKSKRKSATMTFNTNGWGSKNTVEEGECVTVKNGKVLRGESRLKALHDQYVKNRNQNQRMSITDSNSTNIPGFSTFTLYSQSNGGWRPTSHATNEEAKKYVELFNAVKKGDCDQVRTLCTPTKDEDCCHVLVSGYRNLSPLALAINQGDRKMIALLFELMEMQYTPIPVNRNVTKSSRISNYALVTSDDEEEEDMFVDPNSDASNIINTCDVGVVFTERCVFDMTGCPSYRSYPQRSRSTGYCISSFGSGYGSSFGSFGDNMDEEGDEMEDISKKEECSIFEYLIYRGDVALLKECFDHFQKLSAAVMEKDEKAHRVKKEEVFEKSIMNSVFSARVSRSYNDHSVNLLFPAIMSDNIDILRCVMRYTMGGLEVLRDKDVNPTEKPKKVKHALGYNDYSDEELSDCSDFSDMEEEENSENAMEVEDDREEGEPESEASEYADSDEEDMKAMRQFREEGKKTDTTRKNVRIVKLINK